jgi:murein DD-endopeptidase MepM/ murein hydrolase activator NlpD
MRLSRRHFLPLAGAAAVFSAFPNPSFACSGRRRMPTAAIGDVADPTFKWPVTGQVVRDFCSNASNDPGIDIVVPEGTIVNAAADGVVAYAGHDLKDYGSAIFLRHQNLWVTAYAFNLTLLVERGDLVRQGQPIARADRVSEVGLTLRFEMRRGAEPVDPTDYLQN